MYRHTTTTTKIWFYLSRPLSFLFSLLLFFLSSFPIAPFSICVIQKPSSEKNSFFQDTYCIWITVKYTSTQKSKEPNSLNKNCLQMHGCFHACFCVCVYVSIMCVVCVYVYVWISVNMLVYMCMFVCICICICILYKNAIIIIWSLTFPTLKTGL